MQCVALSSGVVRHRKATHCIRCERTLTGAQQVCRFLDNHLQTKEYIVVITDNFFLSAGVRSFVVVRQILDWQQP